MFTSSSRIGRLATTVAAFVLVGLPPAANAVDGVIEINQAKIDAGGLGFFRITSPGSYVLTSNITVATTDSAIVFTLGVNDVTLDLNGFTISGPGTGLDNGIQINDNKNIEIRNGTVRDFNRGIQIAFGTVEHIRFIDLRIVDNLSAGLATSNGNEVEIRNCTVVDNGGVGISAGQNSLIVGNRVTGNSSTGITMGTGSGYGGNLINDNVGTVSGGDEIAPNICDDDLTCP